jgi:hypothetical protein
MAAAAAERKPSVAHNPQKSPTIPQLQELFF